MSSYYLAVSAVKAAEVRAAVLAEVEVGVRARAAELAVAAAKKELQYDSKDQPSGREMFELEESVRLARADEAVAKARVSLLRWELKALQLRASGHAEDTAAVPEMPDVVPMAPAVAAEVPGPARDW